ncbi:unnamed protein product [Lactuca saligna]|uniref:FBD domain-containing protein n=1 Tax=Lactuca saligna TaxID=75948 RepID=A0AA35ZEX3_LACSI|nr:unnamed protein product [Lactuca saligna]
MLINCAIFHPGRNCLMEQRDWNELPVHCLVEVFGRVGIESLVETCPFVCKSCSKHPIPRLELDKDSWSDCCLVVPLDQTKYADESFEKFVKFAIGRSHGLVTAIVFHPKSLLKEGQIAWIAQRCPSLKLLVLPSYLSYVINFEVSNSICNWKDLEALQIASLIGLKKTIANITSQLPHLKTLDLRFSTIERNTLIMIIKGCQELEQLDVSKFKGVAGDHEIQELASRICVFKHEGS